MFFAVQKKLKRMVYKLYCGFRSEAEPSNTNADKNIGLILNEFGSLIYFLQMMPGHLWWKTTPTKEGASRFFLLLHSHVNPWDFFWSFKISLVLKKGRTFSMLRAMFGIFNWLKKNVIAHSVVSPQPQQNYWTLIFTDLIWFYLYHSKSVSICLYEKKKREHHLLFFF